MKSECRRKSEMDYRTQKRMIKLESFSPADFDDLIAWTDSEELLITIAGRDLSYPLDATQLRAYLNDPKSHSFRVVDTSTGASIGHAEIRLMGDGVCKLDKVLIGDKSDRGQGIGLQVIRALTDYSFENLGAKLVELNVFEWNTAGIKCYTKAGFRFNPDKRQIMRVAGNDWIVLNMIINRQ